MTRVFQTFFISNPEDTVCIAHLPKEFFMFIQRTLALCALAVTATAETAIAAPTGVLPSLHHIATIGSTIDAQNGDRNPYGLAISPAAGGNISAGDLVVCNFNNAQNIQGLGTTIEVLHPVPGAQPQRLSASPYLTGCSALALGGSDPWVAALDANDNPVVSNTGTIVTPINNFPFTGPWGQTFALPTKGAPSFYESNANDGSIVRINLTSPFTFEKIATGFSMNHGVPGGILAPSGLTYDAVHDVLYIVEGMTNRVIAINAPENVHTGGITVTRYGYTGPSASAVHIVYQGAPLAAPISAALLYNGDLVVGNTANNQLVEIAPGFGVVARRTLDTGAPGALFGIAASGTSAATTRIYFNDDNSNTVQVLMP
jgi:hypothetical protein